MTQATPKAPEYEELVRLLIRLHMTLTGKPRAGDVGQIERSFFALTDVLDRVAIAQLTGALPDYAEVVPRLEPTVPHIRAGEAMATLLLSLACPTPTICGEAFCLAAHHAVAEWRRWNRT